MRVRVRAHGADGVGGDGVGGVLSQVPIVRVCVSARKELTIFPSPDRACACARR